MKNINNVHQELLTAVETSAYKDKVIVFGEGAENPALMMIGEAPGGDEEKQGRPFVGKAGEKPVRLSGSGWIETRRSLHFQCGETAPYERKPQNRQIREPPSFF